MKHFVGTVWVLKSLFFPTVWRLFGPCMTTDYGSIWLKFLGHVQPMHLLLQSKTLWLSLVCVEVWLNFIPIIHSAALGTPSCLWRGCRESWGTWRWGLHLLQHTDSNTQTASKWGSINGFVFLQRVSSWHIVSYRSYCGESSYCMALWHYIDTSRLKTQVNDQDPETPLGSAKILDVPKALTLCESTADELSRRIRNTCAEGLRIHTCQKLLFKCHHCFAKRTQCRRQLCL